MELRLDAVKVEDRFTVARPLAMVTPSSCVPRGMAVVILGSAAFSLVEGPARRAIRAAEATAEAAGTERTTGTRVRVPPVTSGIRKYARTVMVGPGVGVGVGVGVGAVDALGVAVGVGVTADASGVGDGVGVGATLALGGTLAIANGTLANGTLADGRLAEGAPETLGVGDPVLVAHAATRIRTTRERSDRVRTM